jgi:tRNA U34 5-methylaminomethyl-2-thiouridine-forming methyltransferase MnmC
VREEGAREKFCAFCFPSRQIWSVRPNDNYKLVQLANGSYSLHSIEYRETMHPAAGPAAEAEILYVQQLALAERLRNHMGEFVIWDVGLGGAANALTILRATREVPGLIRLVSFDNTLAPLEFALQHAEKLGYLESYESVVTRILRRCCTAFRNGRLSVTWDVHVTDFPALLKQSFANQLPKPHLIVFDPFSPARNPAMWTQSLFADLFRLLDPSGLCVMPTYSRSTMLRVSLLLAGFFVGTGPAIGLKEETTIAAKRLTLISQPLGRRWLERASISGSAEPLWEPVYRQARLTSMTKERLRRHPQFG